MVFADIAQLSIDNDPIKPCFRAFVHTWKADYIKFWGFNVTVAQEHYSMYDIVIHVDTSSQNEKMNGPWLRRNKGQILLLMPVSN